MSTIICSKNWTAHKWQRFRFTPSGQQHVLTQTKGGKTSIWRLKGYRRTAKGVAFEQWAKCDADAAARALNELAIVYGRDYSLTQFFGGHDVEVAS